MAGERLASAMPRLLSDARLLWPWTVGARPIVTSRNVETADPLGSVSPHGGAMLGRKQSIFRSLDPQKQPF